MALSSNFRKPMTKGLLEPMDKMPHGSQQHPIKTAILSGTVKNPLLTSNWNSIMENYPIGDSSLTLLTKMILRLMWEAPVFVYLIIRRVCLRVERPQTNNKSFSYMISTRKRRKWIRKLKTTSARFWPKRKLLNLYPNLWAKTILE